MNLIRTNLMIVRTINSCDKDEFKTCIDQVWKIPGIFSRKRYLWNIMRGRDFYRMMSWYITELIHNNSDDGDTFQQVEFIIGEILSTTKSEKTKQSFIRNLTKSVPLLTVDTIQYIPSERIRSILKSGSIAYIDKHLLPFMEEIIECRHQCEILKEDIDTLNMIIDQ